MFSLARALFSPGSAEDRSSLFAWFIDSMARSDSSRACVSAVWLWAFADRPLVPLRVEALQRSPGSRACCFSACAGSSTTQDRLLARDYRETAVWPSSNQERVGALVLRFSKLNSPAHRYPCLRFKRHLAMPPARLRAKMESLAPFLQDSFIPCNMPV
jgi:hypothetical protein